MAKLLKFPQKKKEVPRGPRGGILLRVGQTWCRNPDGREVVIRALGPKDHRGKQRVYFSNKRSRMPHWDELAEMSFRGNYMEKSSYIVFCRETEIAFRQMAEAHNAGDGIYRLFDMPTPEEYATGLTQVEKPRKQPVPKRGELWRSNHPGRRGYVIYLIKEVSRSQWGGYVITFVGRGFWGVGPCDEFRQERTRIGWLGEVPTK